MTFHSLTIPFIYCHQSHSLSLSITTSHIYTHMRTPIHPSSYVLTGWWKIELHLLIMDHLGIQPPSTKVERRLVEKNRRNQMKILYNKLNSLLPSYNPKEALPLPDQVDEAINYIKSLEAKVKLAQEKKESLQGIKKRSRGGFSNDSANFAATRFPKSPQLEILEVGSSLQVVLTCGIDQQFIFYQIIRMLHEENIEVRSANSSLTGDSMLHVVHAEIPQSFLQFGAAKVSERLKRLVNGSYSDVETQQEWWDFEIGTDDIWGF